ncbi:MAG: hypothetical protein DMF72_05520 [Acidobacteria bacterium]|nr:MAG: hypothetical protein DMF72_05520 [Acidobacteriota bacterium]
MVLKEPARDLDRFDRFRTRLWPQSRFRGSTQLPVNSAGDFHLQIKSRTAPPTMAAHRMQNACVPQKENQCQES